MCVQTFPLAQVDLKKKEVCLQQGTPDLQG